MAENTTTEINTGITSLPQSSLAEPTAAESRETVADSLGGWRADLHHHDLDIFGVMDRLASPIDPWRLVESRPQGLPLGLAETLFTVANGYLGLRGNPPEGRDSHSHGTYINGLHETWSIQHAEDAYGLAREGQAMVNAPDAKTMRLYIDDEPLRLSNAEIDDYERTLDFRTGILRRSLVWRTNAGKKVRVVAERMVSLTERHLAVLSLEVELLEGSGPIVISSEILNRQDGQDEFHDAANAEGAHFDPRRSEVFDSRVFVPQYQKQHSDTNIVLGYSCANSGMTLAVQAEHLIRSSMPVNTKTYLEADSAKVITHVQGEVGTKVRMEKFVSYHSSRHISAKELAFRCARTVHRAVELGYDKLQQDQKDYLSDFWARSDVEVSGRPGIQQAVRWNLFQLLQVAARAESNGIPAKGLTGTGYGGHYFWDTEIYVLPFLSYTNPLYARNALRFRYKMLPAARQRAAELGHPGALFPWRTINGMESSAYYAAGTAQYHIDADIVYALMQYVRATNDIDFLLDEGVEILVETARMWSDLGFFNADESLFQIHSVTGPDEYTTVVNNNLYTNVMASFNLRTAATVLAQMAEARPADFGVLCQKMNISEAEITQWGRAADVMAIPFNAELGVHPQDDQFLNREIWNRDDPDTGPKRPLLLHYHPLVIYRYQILKQADVVLALFLQGDRFSQEEKKADFDYYDPLTTGDSSLSAVVQSIVAAEIGYSQKALDYFYRGLYVDLGDLHHNTDVGVHVASAGGVWSALVYGFGGFRDHGGQYSIDPKLPTDFPQLTYRVSIHGVRLKVTARQHSVEVVLEDTGGRADAALGPIRVAGREVMVSTDPITIQIGDHVSEENIPDQDDAQPLEG